MKGSVTYKYVGNGACLANVPTRDLSEHEALEFGVKLLLGSKLYKKETSRREQPRDDGILEEMEVTNDTGN
jgi:hypothetical protein